MAAGVGPVPPPCAIEPPKTRCELLPSRPGWCRPWRAGDPVHRSPSHDTPPRCRLRPASSRDIARSHCGRPSMPPRTRQLAHPIGEILEIMAGRSALAPGGAPQASRRRTLQTAPPSVPMNRSSVALREAPTLACRSEEHTSELQSLRHLVCRLLLEKKKKNNNK